MRKRARSPSTSSSGEFTPESASFSAPSESSTEESNEGHQRKIRGSLPRHYRLNQRPVNKSASNGVAVKPLFPAVSMTQLRQHWERDRQLKIAAREVAASKRALQQYLKGMRLRPLTEPEEVTDVKIEKKMIYVGAAQERKKFLTYIPTAVTVREYDDATIRSYVVPEDEHEDSCWNANLTNWNHDKDKSYQNKLSFARYIKSQHPSKVPLLLSGRNIPDSADITESCTRFASDPDGRHPNLALLLCRVCGLLGCPTHIPSNKPQKLPAVEVPKRIRIRDPCGDGCWYHLPNGNSLHPPSDGWSEEELSMLTKAAKCFGPSNFCEMSTAFLVRSCADVYLMISALDTLDLLEGRYDRNLIENVAENIGQSRRLAAIIRVPSPEPAHYTPRGHRRHTEPCECEDTEHIEYAAVCTSSCPCAKSGNYCERTCACSKSCPYRYKGCDCARGCQRPLVTKADSRYMLDSDNTTCLCVLHDRECDPDLCGACGADEHWTSGANPSCGNQAIQRRLRKHVSVGDSTVHGRGAFLREDVKEGEFIGEYVGGLISPDECDRRACVSEQAHLNYVFTLLEPQDSFSRQHLSSDVDAFRKGNKTKFINASETADQTNVFAAVRVVVGESRIGIYAARDIASGEELFIDYGEKYKGKSSGMHIDPPRQSLKPKSKKMKNETG